MIHIIFEYIIQLNNNKTNNGGKIISVIKKIFFQLRFFNKIFKMEYLFIEIYLSIPFLFFYNTDKYYFEADKFIYRH